MSASRSIRLILAVFLPWRMLAGIAGGWARSLVRCHRFAPAAVRSGAGCVRAGLGTWPQLTRTPHSRVRAGLLLPALAVVGLTLSACGTGRQSAIECAPYARAVSGLQLFGDAASWWDAAEGRYPRGPTPTPGSVLVFRRSPRLPDGHVSVVASVVAPREIEVTQANWVHGRIAAHEPVIDVSASNDWSAVRVWWEPAGQLGSSVYATYGFIGVPASDRLASEPGSRQLRESGRFQFGAAEASVPPAATRD